eukprot:TRINITY_DN35095_c0_g2_i2.p1 TRINITY_DN35095_c0_g2~~TRINITY_DN35095_c0_g2_i2.p1  ORF type:complete len:569 (+),score=122.57 TRINITY_DN35095_c0_g2_i2:88-1794(+)
MDSLEDVDLIRSLNFASSLGFLEIVEQELASLVLAAQKAHAEAPRSSERRCRLTFPPLKPRYATLLQVTAARFGLRASPHGWGDERRFQVEAGSNTRLPAIQCTDFLPLGSARLQLQGDRSGDDSRPSKRRCLGQRCFAPRLADISSASPLYKSTPSTAKAGGEEDTKTVDTAAAASTSAPSPSKPEVETADNPTTVSKSTKSSGMRGWSDDEDDDWLAKRRRASEAKSQEGSDDPPAAGAASAPAAEADSSERRASGYTGADKGRVKRGRGFAKDSDKDVKTVGPSDEDAQDCQLQKDYEKYMIDPEDTWRPHKKPWVEMTGAWEFSNAWSFDPDDQERFEEASGNTRERREDDSRGVLVWRVEHAKGGDFSVAIIEGAPGEARRWLDGAQRGGRGQEPFVLDFRLDVAGQTWSYRFGRATRLQQSWRPLPWTNMHRTSFWLATFPGEDGRQHLMMGLDEFPERRAFFAKVQLRPQSVGFGPPMAVDDDAQVSSGGQGRGNRRSTRQRPEPFYIRDIAVYGRASLLPAPFASRDHIVELLLDPDASLTCAEAWLQTCLMNTCMDSKE